MKSFLLNICKLGIPIVVLLISVNYFGDAAHVFKRNYEQKIAEIISNGSHATNITNYDERVFQEEFIKRLNFKPDVVVLGSSRAMMIRDSLPNLKLINNSVSGASIEDIIAIYQIYKNDNKLPSKFIIGIDPWIFNDNNGQNRWKSISSYYYAFHEQQKANEMTDKYKQLFSLSYFQKSLKNIPNRISGADEPLPTEESHNFLNTKLRDGSLVYGKSFREASDIEIHRKASNYASGSIYSLGNFDSLSSAYRKEFEKLISELKVKNIEVEFFLAPYHPLVFKEIQKNFKAVLKVENYIKKYSFENDILVYGSFDPIILSLTESVFYDGMHLKEKGVRIILSK